MDKERQPKRPMRPKAQASRLAALTLLVAAAAPCGFAEERAIKLRVAPVYPEVAKRMRIAGVVHLEVTVDSEGKVTEVKTLSGSRMLAPAAEDAVRKWRFASGPGEATVPVDVNFAVSP